ncbi:triose-phosphate isomerase [Candidatus Dojkabacteria bacterium]|nr:triose-phosphate isomerase [Candidatus Dojkabacteria bacterium]
MIILNFKTYPQCTGQKVLDVLKELDNNRKNTDDFNEIVYIAPAMIDLNRAVLDFPELNIMCQHTDAIEDGSKTGWSPVPSIKNLGVEITMLNHSEHRVKPNELKNQIRFIQENGIKVVVCCEDTKEASKLLEAKPYAIAYEPKELIGSGRSVSNEKPEIVKEFIEICSGKTLPLIGAGVSTGKDIKVGLELGAKGFLIASAFTKAENRTEKINEFISPYLT